jgi:hypothetical protein
MNTWLVRVLWVSLPVTAGDALADAIGSWADAPRIVATVLLWSGWAVVLSAVLVPRPLALTITRIGTPLAVASMIVVGAGGEAGTASWLIGLSVTVATCALAVRGEFARICAQGAAYGDEERFPLKVPPSLAYVIVPLAVVVVGVGCALGPLLIADRRWFAGAAAVVVGWPIAFVVARLVHQLSRRWIVLVPAGLVIADPLTLTDPVLFVRESIQGLGPADPGRRPPADAVDLRLGAMFGSCALLLEEEVDVLRRSRRQGVKVRAGLFLFTPTAAERMVARAGARRIRVRRN